MEAAQGSASCAGKPQPLGFMPCCMFAFCVSDFAALAFTKPSHILISKMQSVKKRTESCVVCI